MPTQTEPVVLFEVTDGVGWITFNRPKAYNALDRELAVQLLEALIRCDEDEGVRAVVVAGKEPVASATMRRAGGFARERAISG